MTEGVAAEQANYDQLAANLEELNEEKLSASVQKATDQRDTANADMESAVAGIEAAQNEMAGAENGDGRDASNRSLQERLQCAQNSQVCI